MKKLHLDLENLIVDSFTMEEPGEYSDVFGPTIHTETPGQCSHMNMCLEP